jgi:hypothetical protein
MKSIKLSLPVILAAILIISCGSGPEPTPAPVSTTATVATTTTVAQQTPSQPAVFDPRTITQAQYETTRAEVQLFIERLNLIIRNRNYEQWRAVLSPEYYAEISSAENLRRISELDAMRSRGIVLRTARDYFLNVVVPARANTVLDDIEFITMTRVRAFTERVSAGERRREILYDLEKINNSWTIIN